MTLSREKEGNQRVRRALAIALFLTMLGLTYACSLIVENSSQQCQSDSDCSQFGAALCDLSQHVCVAKSDGGAGADGSCVGAGAAATNVQILNACTDSSCKPFDNKARCTNLTADGGRPPIP